jgi:thioredoxin 1
MRNISLIIFIVAMFVSLSSCTAEPASFPLEEALADGKPVLAEFGGTNCIPCKEMWPILKELSQEYEGILNIVVVDVAKYQDLADKYGVTMIPMQLYFDTTGQVINRHVGAVTKEEIYVQLNNMGVRGPSPDLK